MKIINFRFVCLTISFSFVSILLSVTTANTKQQNQSNTDLIKGILENLSNNDLKEKCYLKQIDLNGDGKKEVFIRRVNELCGGGNRCSIWIGKRQENQLKTILEGTSISPDFAMLSNKTNGWKDVATRSSLGKEFWSIWKFNGKSYQVISQK